jgi:cell division protein FtsI/penicillin-binding protein 2
LGKDWEISPLALARAYCELTSRSAERRVAEILAGLKIAAESGTASAIGSGALAKTGTAPCVAKRKHKGDGFTIVLAPADAPRIAILVRVHGVPGAEAAKSAAVILKRNYR